MRRASLVGTVAAILTLSAGSIAYAHGGDTTEDHTIVEGPEIRQGFYALVDGPGAPRVVRGLPGVDPQPGRETRRRSLTYFGQLTDFQLADEESPARVEFADTGASAAWRPQEAFHPWAIDYSFRQINHFTGASPHLQGDGSGAPMDFALLTGDQSDNQQYNETVWVRQLIEGGQTLDPNSGVSDYDRWCDPATRVALAAKPGEAARYTGVQDYSDYPPGNHDFYDPNRPEGAHYENWPQYPGLMDRAQKPFTPVGLRRGSNPVPTYIANGNHDGLVQGNEDAVAAVERIAIGCFKPFVHAPFASRSSPSGDPDPSQLVGLTSGFAVPPDPGRRFVDRIQLKEIYSAGRQSDDHGLAYVDPDQNSASGGAATYYSWSPRPGLRFVSIDTVSDGGTVQDSSEGNIDNPQWLWLQGQLAAAKDAGEITVVFGHHPIRSLVSRTPDEAASPCTVQDEHGHDVNPGCDLDPRDSQPLHLGADLSALLSTYPNVIAYVAGHTHDNAIMPCGSAAGCPAGANWWELTTSATADWPQQHRLVEVMDNGDGTLSIFGTLLDHAAKTEIPQEKKKTINNEELAALGRSFSYNDPQSAHGATGDPEDQNVELLVDDPRT